VAYYDLLARNELFIANGDALVVNGWNSVVGQSLTIRTRRRTPQGDLVTSENTLALTANRQANTLAISLNDGTLVGVAVHPTVAVQRGQTFVRIGLARGTGNPEQVILAQDYVTAAAPLAWPGGRMSSPTEGPGAIRIIIGTNPPPGIGYSTETVPTNAVWELRSISATLVTDATSTVRLPVIEILLDETTPLYYYGSPTSQLGNLTVNHFFVQAGTEHATRDSTRVGMLPLGARLRGGLQIRYRVSNMQAGDDLSSPRLLVEEWIDA
jgi:hypothetical protein